uniref:Uncharacterized protein n=1 Tax=Utricularia reniformis TaxID=192314 RepID=A0A1Y0B458_9LAMI|nr:hypothetical protein AEK19_MT2044 [Utricularia reniformis]ART32201.1 hypothetical protein AEK19_MT2044 [Utricularia reniformis]
MAQPPKKFSHGHGSGESDLCDASISGEDRLFLHPRMHVDCIYSRLS